MNLTISDFMLDSCNSNEATAIYIGPQLSILHSILANIEIINSQSAKIGMISDFHYYGILSIINLKMRNNTAPNAGVVSVCTALYSDEGLYTSIQLIDISNSQSSSPVFIFSSQNTDMFISLQRAAITNIFTTEGKPADIVSIVAIGCIMKDIEIKQVNSVIIAKSYANIQIYNGNFMYLSGVFATLAGSVKFTCINCKLNSISNSVFVAETYSNIILHQSTFAYISNYFAQITGSVSLSCFQCDVSFASNSLILASSNSIVSLTQSIFHNNSVSNDITPMISVVSSSSYFIDTTFSDNIAIAGKSFYFAYAILSINGCNFARNSASSSAYSGIYALASTLSIENSDFSSQTSKETGGFISAIGSSSVTINSTSFSQGYSQRGGAIYIDSSTLLIDSCSFTQNTGYISGGGVYATNTQVTILNSTFNSGLSLLGDAIFMDSQSLTIKNSQFKGSQSVGETSTSSVYVLSSSYIGITNCSFTSPLNVVSALISESSQYVLISDSVFEEYCRGATRSS